jgi:hypothetical protein
MKVSGQFHASAALPRSKGPRYPLDKRLRGSQRRFWRGGKEKNSIIAPAGTELWSSNP